MDDLNELSPIERLALRARHVGPQGEGLQEPPRLRMVSFRVPVDLLASVSALAGLMAQSRNTTMIELLEAGVYAVVNALDDPERFHAAREHFLEQNTGE